MFLFEWLRDVLQELRTLYEDNLSSGGPARRMERQLRIMYGRGEINKKIFFELLNSLEKGYFIEGELKMYHRQAVVRLQMEGKFVDHHFNAEIGRGLENIYMNRARLEEVRLEMSQALKTIEVNRVWIQQQAAAIRENALTALPDESSARALLEVRQDLLERAKMMERRGQAVQQNLRQLDTLEAELGMAEAELMLVESQEHYAKVKLALYR